MIDKYGYNHPGDPRESDCFVLPFPPNSKLARPFFVYQRYTTSFPPREALDKGTMFPDLFTPWPNNHRNTV